MKNLLFLAVILILIGGCGKDKPASEMENQQETEATAMEAVPAEAAPAEEAATEEAPVEEAAAQEAPAAGSSS